MRVLIVSQYFWPENFRINDLAVYLAAKGHQVTVLTGLPNYPDGEVFKSYQSQPKAFDFLGEVEVVRVPLVPRGSGSWGLVLNYLSFALTATVLGPWKLRGRNYDTVFVNQLSPVTVGLPGALLAWIKSAQMIMWVQDLWPDTLQAIGVVRSQRVLGWLKGLVSFIYSHCDLILAQSQSFIPAIRKLAPPTVAIQYLPSWAEDVFQNQGLSPELSIPECEGAFDVMFAGNIGEAQDFPCILAAAEKLRQYPNIRWLIVGDGRMRQWLEKEIQVRGLTRHVFILGRFPVERMPDFYQRAHALLVTLQDKPIFNMTIPGKLQSYLAVGKPIVGAINGEGAALIRNAGAGYVCAAGDYHALASVVLALSRLSQTERDVMGNNGRRVSDLEFNRSVVLGKVEGFLKAISESPACKTERFEI